MHEPGFGTQQPRGSCPAESAYQGAAEIAGGGWGGSKGIIRAEWEANAPLREAMATKRERWRAKRAAIERAAKQRPSK